MQVRSKSSLTIHEELLGPVRIGRFKAGLEPSAVPQAIALGNPEISYLKFRIFNIVLRNYFFLLSYNFHAKTSLPPKIKYSMFVLIFLITCACLRSLYVK